MNHRHGFALLDTLISLALFSTILATVFSMMAAGQSGFLTNGAFLQAQQTARNAADIIEQELKGAQIINDYISTDQNVLMYVTYRKMTPGIVDTAAGSAFGTPLWDNTKNYILLWCPNGAAGNPVPFWGNNSCATISGYQPEAGDLVLLAQANVWAAPQVFQRVVAKRLRTFAQDGQRGFEFSIVRPACTGCPCTGDSFSCPATPQDTAVAGNFTSCGFAAFAFVCRNEPGHAFQFYAGLPYYSESQPLYLRMDYTIRARGRTWQGRVVPAQDVKGTVFFLNRQDKPS